MKSLFLSICFLAFSLNSIIADEIVLVADFWPPFFDIQNTDNPGYAVELSREIFTAAGHTVKFEIVPWSRAVDGTSTGLYSAAIGAFDGDVPGAILPTESIGFSTNTFFVKKGDSWRYSGISSLAKKRVGLIQDYNYDYGDFDKWAATTKEVGWMAGDEALFTNLRMLVAGRLDAIIDDSNVIIYLAKQKNLLSQIEPAGTLGEKAPLYIAFSGKQPKGKEYAKIFSEGLAALRKNGKLNLILAKYGMKDWK